MWVEGGYGATGLPFVTFSAPRVLDCLLGPLSALLYFVVGDSARFTFLGHVVDHKFF